MMPSAYVVEFVPDVMTFLPPRYEWFWTTPVTEPQPRLVDTRRL